MKRDLYLLFTVECVLKRALKMDVLALAEDDFGSIKITFYVPFIFFLRFISFLDELAVLCWVYYS